MLALTKRLTAGYGGNGHSIGDRAQWEQRKMHFHLLTHPLFHSGATVLGGVAGGIAGFYLLVDQHCTGTIIPLTLKCVNAFGSTPWTFESGVFVGSAIGIALGLVIGYLTKRSNAT